MASLSISPKNNILAEDGPTLTRNITKLNKPQVRKCPIYVHKSNSNKDRTNTQPNDHKISESNQTIRKNLEKDKNISRTKSTESNTSPGKIKSPKKYNIDKLEEAYWSQWKPNKDGILMEVAKVQRKKLTKRNERKIDKGDGDNTKSLNTENITDKIKNNSVISKIKPTAELTKIEEVTEEDNETSYISDKSNTEETEEIKFIKHTDSFILNTKKKSEEKNKYQQPRCIRLYKKSYSSSYVRGGSYPLKSCLKKESSFNGNSRRPLSGSPYSLNMFKPTKNKFKSSSFSK
ncbi:hypothetical protein HHI36_011690 [Cryptolaemus montrouzieri]|uniref:Uncharacterized protein n=1 Tax=Cryptolaemus montrouzieri TaxID=559131 RepID=A0ABD2MMK5_9CUCU